MLAGAPARAGRRPIRFGLLCRGTTFPEWQARCLRHLLALEGVEAALLILDERPTPAGQASAQPPQLRHLLWWLYASLQLRRAAATRPADLATLLAAVPTLSWRTTGTDPDEESFRDEDLAAIRRRDLDFILHFAADAPRGAVLDVPRCGVWAFRFGEGGGLPGFWEVYHGDPSAGATLQRLLPRRQPGLTLYQGHLKTFRFSYVRSYDELLLSVVDWPARVCKDLQHGVAAPRDARPVPADAQRDHLPTNPQMVRLLFALARRALVGGFGILFRSEQWTIGIVDAPIQTFLVPGARPPIRWFPEIPAGWFIADPFALGRGDDTAVLVEAFSYRRGKGHIAALELSAAGAITAPRPVIEAPTHLSYPYLVEDRGEIYCIPESAAARKVTLYKAVEFPRRWVEHATLIEGFPARDATVFRHGDRWWLLCSMGEGGHESRLYGWYAPELVGPWTPHPANPLKTDVRSSRPAGTPFTDAGRLYRPAQDCSRTYGGAITINQVRRLTPTEFDEVAVTVVTPYPDSPYPHGLHTLSACGQRTMIDAKRLRFSWPATRQVVRSLGSTLRPLLTYR